jgi:AraC-like DNA-binding protein
VDAHRGRPAVTSFRVLARNDLSVTRVCFAVGFASLGSFSALFSDRVGVAPSALQRDA